MSDYSALVIADGGVNLIGYWPLDAEFGLTDKSGAGNNGSAVGSGLVVGGVPAAGGELTGTALDGSTQGIATALVVAAVGAVRTFEGWTLRKSNSTGDNLFAGSVGNSPALRLDGGAQSLSFFPDRGGVGYNPNGTWPGNNQWVHWMFRFDDAGDAGRLALNGVLQTNTTGMTGAYNATPGTFRIGIGRTGDDPADIQTAHVAVYNGDQLSLAASHYAAGLKVRPRRRTIVRPTPAAMRAAVR